MEKTNNIFSELLVDEMLRVKEEKHITNATIAQACNMSESTVTKVLNKSSKNSYVDTLLPIATFLGIDTQAVWSKATEKSVAAATTVPAKMLVSQEDKFLNLFLETHNKQIDDLKDQLKIKDKWIKTLTTILIVFACLFASIAIIALAHHDFDLLNTTAEMFDGVTGI